MAVVKFFLVASLVHAPATDQPVFRRFFIVGMRSARAIALPSSCCDVLEHGAEVLRSDAGAGDGRLPAWQPHPDVWLLVGAVRGRVRDRASCGSARGSRRRARRWSPASRSRASSLGVLAMWVASDWPIHDIAERYIFSVHMVQHLMLHHGRRAAAAARHARVAAALGALAPLAVRARCATLARFIPALIALQRRARRSRTGRRSSNAALRYGLVHFVDPHAAASCRR